MWNWTIVLVGTLLCIGVGLYAATTAKLAVTERTSTRTTQTIASSTVSNSLEAPSSTPHANIQSNTQHAYTKATTTVFWVGESADASNGYIANDASAWDSRWQEHFGGYDDPNSRCGYAPCTFAPKENPFYFALPYNDLDDSGKTRSTAAAVIPWWTTVDPPLSQVKNRWIEVVHNARTCYGQWQDVGPYIEDDVAYVFGTAAPQNTFGLRAGLDVSPAMNDCLHLGGSGVTEWRFIDAHKVPPGPWKDVITTRDVSWD